MAPYNNITDIDPLVTDPDNLDFRLENGSPAKGYGCETYYIPESPKNLPEKTYSSILEGRRIPFGGRIVENTLVKADTVDVYNDITISDNTTLNISPGTVILFNGPFRINVEGTLIAEGTPGSRIYFTSLYPDPYDAYDSHLNSWKGIVFDGTLSTNDSSYVKYSVLEYARTISDSTGYMPDCMGGAIYISNFSKVKIENNIFRYNTALYGSSIAAVNNCQPQINNNLFYENYAKYNGPVAYLVNSYPYFYNNTAVNNVISDLNPDYQMGAIYSFRSKPYLVNNIIRDNVTGAFPQVYFYKEYFMHFNNIRGFEGFNGNFDADPLFDISSEIPGVLTEGSPCVDSGSDIVLDQPESDLAGNPRTVNGKIDIGAFEDQNGSSIFQVPATVKLLKIYPNPANPSTRISFDCDIPGQALITIFNVKGERVGDAKEIKTVSGDNYLDLDLGSYVNGLYFIKISADVNKYEGKLLLLK